jgi:hypothetical protein
MMYTHSVVAVSPTTDVAEDNHKNLIIELSRIVRKDSAADVVMPSSKIVSAQKKKGGKYLVVRT